MRVVIDTVVISRITRQPRRSSRQKTATVLDAFIRTGKLVVVVDSNLGLIDEWRKTAGDEPVKRLVETWDTRAFHVVKARNLTGAQSRRLSRLQFRDTVDRLIVRICVGVVAGDRNICSGDSDFWNPRSKQSVGDRTALVAAFLRDELGIEMHTLPQVLTQLND